jgi:NADH dehydrogenase FAD-containing subunit
MGFVYVLYMLLQLVKLPLDILDGLLVSCRRLRSQPSGKRVVVVGGSFAGLHAVRELSEEFDVTLVDCREFWEYVPGSLRLLVEPQLLPYLSGAQPHTTKKNKFLQGFATTVDANARTVQVQTPAAGDLVPVPYDYLVLACGSSYSEPVRSGVSETTIQGRRAVLDTAADKLKAAGTVLIVGNGPVGVELAGEVLDAYPSKNVTLLGVGKSVLDRFPKQVSAHATDWLLANGASLVHEAWVDELYEHECRLADGRTIHADVIYQCTGAPPNSGLVKASPGLAHAIDTKTGAVRVDDTLRVEGHSNVFAAGDMCLHPGSGEVKLAYTAELNAALVVANIRKCEKTTELLSYPSGVVHSHCSPNIVCVSLGKGDAVLSFNGIVVSGALASLMKHLIEMTKVEEMRDAAIGRWFWKFSDVMAHTVNRLMPAPVTVKSD